MAVSERQGMILDVAADLAARGWLEEAPPRTRANEVTVALRKDWLPHACTLLAEGHGAWLATMTGTDERARDGCFRLYYVFSFPGADLFLTLIVAVPKDDPIFPSVTPYLPAANWYEREVQDMLGLTAVGHPDPRRLVLHEDWPSGLHPLRKDFPAGYRPPRAAGEFPFQRVEGEGVMEIPVGPIHAGIIEPGHFRFSAVGETIVNLEARLFYSHRGMEKQAEGLTPERALLLAERLCGQCSASHAAAFAQAVERLGGAEPPPRAQYIRTIALELERLANHLGDIGNICAGTGFAFGAMLGARLREEVMRAAEALAGNRFLRGLTAVGGVRRDLTAEAARVLEFTLQRVDREFRDLCERLLATPSFLDRVQGTGRLSARVVRDLGVVGPAARAAGVDVDVRRDHPYAAYGKLAFSVPLGRDGDVFSRMKVRMDEVGVSVTLVRQALESLVGLPPRLAVPVGDLPPYEAALGYTESPRGANIHWVMAAPDNRIFRYRVRSASYANWPALPIAVQGNIVPDFPLINKSFELCYACLDR